MPILETTTIEDADQLITDLERGSLKGHVSTQPSIVDPRDVVVTWTVFHGHHLIASHGYRTSLDLENAHLQCLNMLRQMIDALFGRVGPKAAL